MPKRPNILFLMSDQHRGDCLDFAPRGAAAPLAVQTPHLRRLAEEGVYFPNFYSEAPVCIPARAILQTGILPHRSRIINNGDVLPEDHPTLAGCLAANGYFTQVVGKMHSRPVRAAHGLQRLWLSEAMPRPGDDEYLQFVLGGGYGHVEEPHGICHEMYYMPQVSPLPETHHNTAWIGRSTVEFLREHVRERAEQPFFCWTSFLKPHAPMDPPAPWHRLYRPSDAPATLKNDDELSWLPTSLRLIAFQQWSEEFPDAHRLATLWAYYFSSISFVDAWIGMILDELEVLGLREDTIVVYTADHGEHLGDHWSWEKNSFYDASARVPGIVSWPGRLPRHRVRQQLAGLADIVPTLLDAAGVEPQPFGLRPDGMSLLPVARDDAPTRDVLIGEVGGHMGGGDAGPQLMALSPDWKYVYAAGDNRELLFRAGSLEGELRNELATGDAGARATAGELRRTLQERLRQDGAGDLLDESSPTGYRLFPALNYPQMLAGDPAVRDRWRQRHFGRWFRNMPEGWTPPPPRPDGGIAAGLPRTADRSRFRWPPLPA